MLFMLFCSLLWADNGKAWGEIRLTSDYQASFSIQNNRFTQQQNHWLRSRTLIGYHLPVSRTVRLLMAGELLNGQFAGQSSNLSPQVKNQFRPILDNKSELQQIWPRQFAIEVQTNRTRTNIGFNSFHWGLGMSNHNGKKESWFGVANRGDINLRTASAVAILPPTSGLGNILVFAAGDMIIRDSYVSIYDGTRGYAALTGLSWGNKNGRAGLLTGKKWYPNTTIVPLDVFFQNRILPVLWLEGEGVYLMANEGNASGGLLRMRLQKTTIGIATEVGYAGGAHGNRQNFHFHGDYNVGLILFEHLLPRLQGAISQPTAEQNGLNNIQGGVHNALYSHSILQLGSGGTVVRFGYLKARSDQGLANTLPVDVGPGDALGDEFDFSLRYGIKARNELKFIATGAVFLPSRSLASFTPKVMWAGHGRIQFKWGSEKPSRKPPPKPKSRPW